MASTNLLDEAFLRRLDRLSLITRKMRAGTMKGERRSTKRGASVEFADYRNYVAGDDLRQIDWNIYARMERLFVKLFEEEEEAVVHILFDASKSMDWGEPNKLDYAKRTAAALGYIALSGMDRLSAAVLRADSFESFPLTRGKSQTLRYLSFLASVKPEGSTHLDRALAVYAQRSRLPGVLVLISDLLSPPGVFDGLRALHSRGFDVAVIHVLAPDEEDPALTGDLRLIDVETGEPCEVSIESGALDAYMAQLAAWKDEIRAFCHGRDIAYFPVCTSLSIDNLILFHLRRRRLIR